MMSLESTLNLMINKITQNLISLYQLEEKRIFLDDTEVDITFNESKALKTDLSSLKLLVEELAKTEILSEDCQIFQFVIKLMREKHVFSRECGFLICESIFRRFGKFIVEQEVTRHHADTLSIIIGFGLSDNESDAVRLAAGKTARSFLLSFFDTEYEERYFPELIPKLCLSRHYIEQSRFLVYSLETWTLITRNEGKFLVAKYIENVIQHLENSAKSELKGSRQAVCNCIGELGRKLDSSIFQPYIPQLLQILENLFFDPQSYIRESSCNACKDLLENYPSDSKLFVGKIFDSSLKLLGDSDFRVRKSSSQLISLIVLRNDMLPESLKIIEQGLQEIKKQPIDQPSQTKRDVNFKPNLCQPWMMSDGTLRMILELSSDATFQKEIVNLIPLMIEVTKPKDYKDHYILIETFLRILPVIGKTIQKRQFKEFLSYFFEIIFYAIESNVEPTMLAGKECLGYLSLLIGPSILKGRIEQFNPKYIVHLV